VLVEEVRMTNVRQPPDGERNDNERNVSPVEAALQQHRRLPPGVTTLLVFGAAVALAVFLPKIESGPQIATRTAQPYLFSVAGALLFFIALVVSLLFLMIQYATTIFTPRLTIFRDDPKVRVAFLAFIGAFVYSAVAGLQMGEVDRQKTSVIVTGFATLLLLVSLFLARTINFRALGLLQMSNMLEELRSQGADVLTRIYTRPAGSAGEPDPLPEITQTVRWTDAGTLLLQVDLAKLGAVAADADAAVRLHVGVGGEILRGGVVFTVHGANSRISDQDLLEHLEVGVDRRFGQDPLLAFRLLTEIGMRALSPAINDPFSAVSAAAAIDDLLRIVADKDLDMGRDADPSGALRVVLKMPTWDDFLSAGVDELAPDAARSTVAAARMESLLDELTGVVPPERRDPVERRRRRFAEIRRREGTIAEHAANGAGESQVEALAASSD
jgi:uncharacterized membrane protein